MLVLAFIYSQTCDFFLKLYCGYKYTSMINRIWVLKQLWLQVNCHAWFQLHWIHWAVGNRLGLKNSKWKYMSRAGFQPKPRHATTGETALSTTRSRHLDSDLWIIVLQDSGIKLITPLRDNTCQSYYSYMCIWTDCLTKSTFLVLNVDFS